jgi:hypothetical protein
MDSPETDTDTKYLKRRDRGTEHGWQFQFELDPLKESKYFSDSKHGDRDGSLAAARRYRDEFIATAVDLGLMTEDWEVAGSDVPIFLNLTARNTSGIVGVCRVVSRRKGTAKAEETWAANYRTNDSKRLQRKFSVNKLGEKGALLAALRFRRDYVSSVVECVTLQHKREQVAKHRDDLGFLIEYVESLVDEADIYTFLSTLNRPDLSVTEKQALIDARIGQASFRKLVLAIWRDACCITGATMFLTAAHIKPWARADSNERLDPYNGLALSPNFDKAFDGGMITFLNDGTIQLSPRFERNAALLGIVGSERIVGLDARHHVYLEYHRNHVFLHGDA